METIPETPREHQKTGLAWFMVVASTSLSLFFNIWHALVWQHSLKDLDPIRAAVLEKLGEGGIVVLAVFIGVVPLAFALLLSKLLASSVATKPPVKVAIYVLFGLAMVMSFIAQFQLMSLLLGANLLAAFIPIILDATDYICLYIISDAHKTNKKIDIEADKAAERARLRADIEADIRPDIEADIRRTYQADIAAAVSAQRADIQADIEADNKAILASERLALKEDMGQALADRIKEMEEKERQRQSSFEERVAEAEERLRAELEVEIAARFRRESSAKTTSRKKAAPTGKDTAPAGDKAAASKDDLKVLLTRSPHLTQAEQANSLGVTDRTIRRWREQLEAEGFVIAPVIPLRKAE